MVVNIRFKIGNKPFKNGDTGSGQLYCPESFFPEIETLTTREEQLAFNQDLDSSPDLQDFYSCNITDIINCGKSLIIEPLEEYDFKDLSEGKYAWNPISNLYQKYTDQTTEDYDIIYFYKSKLILLEALKGPHKYPNNKLPYLN